MAIDRDNPHAKPRTKAEALEMAQMWGNEWSHWNEHCSMTDNTTDNAGADRRLAWVHCAQHDAAEVQRLAALHSMLPDEPVVPLSEVKEALLGKEAKDIALAAFNAAPSTGFVRSFHHALEAVVDHAFASTDSEGQPLWQRLKTFAEEADRG